jgi:excisionase family DNA binding protein
MTRKQSPPQPAPAYLTVAQAADALGLSLPRIREMCREGGLTFTRAGVRVLLIDAASVDAARDRRGVGRPRKAE